MSIRPSRIHALLSSPKTAVAATVLSTALLPAAAPAATPAEAVAFLESAEARLLELAIGSERASWVYSNFITHDTEVLKAKAEEALIAATVKAAMAAPRFDGLELDPDVRRRLGLLKLSLTIPAPTDEIKTQELTRTTTAMQGRFAKGEYCPEGAGEDGCLDITAMGRVLESSRDPRHLEEIWTGWRAVFGDGKGDYQRFVELANEGARGLGFEDLGALWRSKYDMEPAAFAAEMDRLWGQVQPLYQALHCHVRAKLVEAYGEEVVSPDQPLPAHLLGNMWAQTWSNIYDLVAPAGQGAGFDLTKILEGRKVGEREMVEYGEGFFTSLGLAAMPPTFWERSLFRQPRDREVVCHASAWAVDWRDDLRIKMCIQINGEDFGVIHHELGHNYYQRAYNGQPYLYRDSANDGFHEALGDAIALSVTPAYLVKLGFLEGEPPASADLGLLLRMAMDKVAFLPFGLLVDQWRWKVFSGEVGPDAYNASWWALREKYQGIRAPVARSEEDFDAAAKYHVSAVVPYSRYFLAHILQFQFHRGLCKIAGFEGPLHRCSIYGNRAAGERLDAMMAMGLSRPWPDALEALTGEREMDASAILDYFAPLKAWLDEQNRGRTCGW